MRKVFYLLSVLLLLLSSKSFSQAGVLDPTDPDVIYTSTVHPATPAYNNYNILKWGHAADLSWNPYSYGYKSYYFSGMCFRLKFPKSYVPNVADGKKYPIYIFFHGDGEAGTIFDNEKQLLHGGQNHAQNVDNGTFDGFLFYLQNTGGYTQPYFPNVSSLIDSFVKYIKVDIDRVIVEGLSAGGQSVWDFSANNTYNKKVAAMIPISAGGAAYVQYLPNYLTIPIWVANGGQDKAPAPSDVTSDVTAFQNLGGNIKQSFFSTLGHDAWDSLWLVPGYFNYLALQHKANPLVYFQRTQFCASDVVSVHMALNPGFYAYQWDNGGVVIPGATSADFTATSYGTYRGRYQRTSTSGWSAWSPAPVVVSLMPPTVTPPIQINGLYSSVLPSVDGRTTIPLMVPNTYASYQWVRTSDNALVSSNSTYNAPIGQYKVEVTQQFGCSSNFSAPFTVIAAAGTNVPENITNFAATAVSSSSIRLDWNADPAPVYKQTAFEIYRSTTSGSGYVLINIAGPNALTYTDVSLQANTTYYYVIRAINLNGAAPVSTQASVSTIRDVTAPSAPANLRVTGTTRALASIIWNASTDDVGVTEYDIYVNGQKAYITTDTTFTITGLTAFQTYGIYVVAKDKAGNQSPASNQVSATAALQGLTYSYYQGTWNALPDFNTLTPVKTGVTPNVSLSPATQTTNFGFLWTGYINVPTTGTYTFETNSDDGSKLYLSTYNNSNIALVNNDGLHGAQSATGKVTLTAGTYPISITYFQQGGGSSMNVYWTCTTCGISRQLIPNSAFGDVVTIPPANLPIKPSNLTVIASSYNNENLAWIDNSTNESGFEITRSSNLLGTYSDIGTTPAGATSFIDSIGLSPLTKYWYKIRSVNQYGQSDYVSTLLGSWGFNNTFADSSGNNHTLTGGAGASFNSTDFKEGTQSLSTNGTSQYADMPFSSAGAFPSDSYTARSISVWVKPNASTISAANKIIFDLGGADNGIALRFNSSGLEAGIASGNVRSSIVVSAITSNVNWVLGGWNHLTVVYNVNVLQLFLNSVLIGTANLSFSSVGSSTSLSRIGATNTGNAFNSSTSSTFYGGLMDYFVILKEPIASAGIQAVMTNSYTADTTLALPLIPAAPTNLVSTTITTSSISLSFNDNSNNETSFELWRSVGDLSNYRLISTIPSSNGTTVAYTDNNLFANSNYYYKVRAVGIGGASSFTTDLLVKTPDNLPTITSITSFNMRYGSQANVNIAASDLDPGNLVISFPNPLPGFAIFTNTTNGAGTLQLNPAITDQGVYLITVMVTDANQGTSAMSFNVTVNANYTPVVAAISNSTVAEGSITSIPITATDQSGNSSLVWSASSAPSFVTLTDNGSGSGTLSVKPGYAAAGVYQITVNSNDGVGGVGSATFTLTVTNTPLPTQKVYMNMQSSSAGAPLPWNNISSVSKSNLLDSNGVATGINVNFLNTTWQGGNAGAITGNNSGVYPDAVIQDYFYFGVYGAPSTVNVALSGLASTGKYNLTVFGSSAWTGLGNNGTTIYTINGVQKPLYVDHNQQNTVTFNGLVPDNTGTITMNMSFGTGTPYGLINAMVLVKPFDDGTTPILPTNLTATSLPNGTVQLSWTDNAYNEVNYLVYRSTSQTGPFTLLNPGATNANATSYIDGPVASNTNYYYQIEATNANGSSGLTNVVGVLTGDSPPVLSVLNDVVLKAGSNSVVNISATSGAGVTLTTAVSGLPAFATFQNTGNGTGTISLSPSTNDLGVYKNIIVTVTDNSGVSVSDTFKVTVLNSSLRNVYINFGTPGGIPQPAPWNNFMSYPSAGIPLSGLLDDSSVNSGFSVTLLQTWASNFSFGMITGDNSGRFPDNVILNSIVASTTSPLGIQLSGLNPSKKYNVVFMSSVDAGQSAKVTFSSGSQSVTQESKYNSNVSVQLNGLVSDATGKLTVTATKDAAATYLYLNAMVIQEYNVGTPLIRPYYLFAESVLDSNEVKLTWSDQSDNETGFQIYRSTSLQGTYTLVSTTAANITAYTDYGLTPNVRYYYKVNAINAAGPSDFSNIASLVLPLRIVFIDLNSSASQYAGGYWNNTTGASSAGSVFNNLIDDSQLPTGIGMTITKDFNAPGFSGVSTNGIFPGAVMASTYWTDAGTVSEVKFTNLDIRKKYRIGCFGSAVTYQYSTAIYSCNGKSVQLNSVYNDSKIAYLKDLTSTDGNLVVDVVTLSGDPYSFTSAFTIEAYDDPTPYTPVLFNDTSINVNGTGGTGVDGGRNGLVNGLTETPELASSNDTTIGQVSVYPNPFTNKIDVEIVNDKASAITIVLYDLNARMIYKTATTNQPAGKSKITVNVPNSGELLPGFYEVGILEDGKLTHTVKLIKVK
jgi:large repetitive protein